MNSEAIKSEMLKKVTTTPSRESLLELIRWLDIEIHNHPVVENNIYNQLLARSTVALGYELLTDSGPLPNVVITLRSAQEYALNPTQQNWDSFSFDATQSFPFGPGDGCYSVKELITERSCGVGTGCGSGSGCLDLSEIESDKVMKIIASEIVPWLNGTDDPIVSREKVI
jgi:hypothetical protein